MPNSHPGFVRAARLADLPLGSSVAVQIEDHTLALFRQGDAVYAVDNRCPHMGFPLDRGTVQRWHPDLPLASRALRPGQRRYLRSVGRRPAPVPGGGAGRRGVGGPRRRPRTPWRISDRRLQDGLERNIPLVLAKAVIAQLDGGVRPGGAVPRRARVRRPLPAGRLGTGPDHPHLPDEPAPGPRSRRPATGALPRAFGGAHATAMALRPASSCSPCPARRRRIPRSSAGSVASSRCVTPRAPSVAWCRRSGPGRTARSSPTCCSPPPPITATFKADTSSTLPTRPARPWIWPAGSSPNRFWPAWCPATPAASRMEESNAWRHPVDLVAILERAFEALPAAYAQGQRRAAKHQEPVRAVQRLADILLGDDPQAIVDTLLRRAARRLSGRAIGRGGGLCRRAAHRPFPRQQRVLRLGHRPAYLHLCERRPSGAAAGAVGRARARGLRRGDERLP